MTNTELLNTFKSIVGDCAVLQSTGSDTINSWSPVGVIAPGSVEEVSSVLRQASSLGTTVIPRGRASKVCWGNSPVSGGIVLSTTRLSNVLEHVWGDMTATVEAGCSISKLQDVLAQNGQRLALDPAFPDRATVGGVIATNDNGSWRERFGTVRDQLIGITVVLADGTVAKSGGKVVKNVAGYDLPKLMVGSFGTLGVIVDATFRLYPKPYQTRSISVELETNDEVNAFISALRRSGLTPTGLQLRSGKERRPVCDIRLEGTAAVIDSQEKELAAILNCDSVAGPSKETCWSATQAMLEGHNNTVCKLSILPAEIAGLSSWLECEAEIADWGFVMQAAGVGCLSLIGETIAVCGTIERLRSRIEGTGGALVICRCPMEVKTRIDVWGTVGNSLPLMRRVKHLFDPSEILSPGRFVGGI